MGINFTPDECTPYEISPLLFPPNTTEETKTPHKEVTLDRSRRTTFETPDNKTFRSFSLPEAFCLLLTTFVVQKNEEGSLQPSST